MHVEKKFVNSPVERSTKERKDDFGIIERATGRISDAQTDEFKYRGGIFVNNSRVINGTKRKDVWD